MQIDLEIKGRSRRVALTREGGTIRVSIDGREWAVDAVRIDAQTLSLLIEDRSPAVPDRLREGGRRRSYEVVVVPARSGGGLTVHVGAATVTVGVNGRRGLSRKDDDGPSQAGPQHVRAAMPGRVLRVLVKPGDAVKAGQGLVVIEAMKMENELRAARDGTVIDVRAREAMSVEAGALLVVVE